MECTYSPWSTKTITYTQTIEYPRKTIHIDNDFYVEMSLTQVSPGKLLYFLHIEICDFKPSTLKRIKLVWRDKRPKLPPILFAQGDETNNKWIRFVSMFGFTPLINNALCSDGETRHIYVNYLFEDN